MNRPSGLIKSGGKRKHFIGDYLDKVENVSLKQISIIDLNH